MFGLFGTSFPSFTRPGATCETLYPRPTPSQRPITSHMRNDPQFALALIVRLPKARTPRFASTLGRSATFNMRSLKARKRLSLAARFRRAKRKLRPKQKAPKARHHIKRNANNQVTRTPWAQAPHKPCKIWNVTPDFANNVSQKAGRAAFCAHASVESRMQNHFA